MWFCSVLVIFVHAGFIVADMVCGSLEKRSGTKFRFRGLPEELKIIIQEPFYEEKGGMTTTTRHGTTRHDTETPEPSQPPLLFALRDEIPREDIPSLR